MKGHVNAPLRSWLFVPGGNEKMLGKVAGIKSDAIILDLEDAVAPERKEYARGLVRKTLDTLETGARVYVRINAFESGQTEADVKAIARKGLAGVMLAKAETPVQLKKLDAILTDAESLAGLSPGSLEVVPLVETPLGVLNALPVVFSTRVRAIALGGEDLAATIGATRSPEGRELEFARGMIVTAAGAGGVPAIDTVWVDVADEKGLEAEAADVRRRGFTGKLAIHPRQVPIIEAAFSPTRAEIDQAWRIMVAFEEANTGAISVDGKMVDEPVVRRARSVLALAGENGMVDREGARE